MNRQKTLEEVKNIIADHKKELQEKYKVKEIGIFGSYVHNQQDTKSDLDILVDFEENAVVGLFKFMNLIEYLETILDTKVDLVTRPALKPRIGKNILNELVKV